MYELVNTSLPNGLIAGTHGYATVAMTRGLPDALATRLDALSAYAHRTSAHDASYARENPVNWQHLVLPQGEHVVSRIAPAPFDYTGRTNRLARHLCFTRGEPLLANGAARVLEVAQAWFIAPWEGKARWLEPDRALEGTFAAEAPRPVATAAPHWEALLGAGKGLAAARRVAQFARANLRAPGKSLSFRADAAQDADGMRLLGLFADIIALLPPDARRDVTFATYAASLPTGVGCLLRGVFDDTPAFKVTSAVQPWIDCVRGRIVHEELLPEWVEETSRAVETKARVTASVGTEEKDLPALKPLPVLPRTTGTPSVERPLVKMPPPWWRDGLVWTAVAVFVLVLAGGGTGMWYVLTHADAGNATPEETATEAPLKQLADQQRALNEQRVADEQRERRVQEEARRKAEEERRARKAKERAEKEAEAKAERAKWIELAKKDKANKTRETEDRAKTEADAVAKRATAYLDFQGAVVWRAPDKDLREDRTAFEGKDACWVYYADAAGTVVPHPVTVTKRANAASGTMVYRFEPDSKNLPTDVPFALWYAGGSHRLHWQWIKTTFAGLHFENASTPIDVWGLLTARDANVGRALERSGFTLNYALEFTARSGTAKSFTIPNLHQKKISARDVLAQTETLRDATAQEELEAYQEATNTVARLENEKRACEEKEEAYKKKENSFAIYPKSDSEREKKRVETARKDQHVWKTSVKKDREANAKRMKQLGAELADARSRTNLARNRFENARGAYKPPTETELVEQWSFTIRVDVNAGRPDGKGEN